MNSFQLPPQHELKKAGRDERKNIFRRYFASSRYNRLLIQQTLVTYGYNLSPLHLALWAIPTAIAAFLIHGTRLILFDRKFARRGR